MNRFEESCEEEHTHFAFGQLEQKIHDQQAIIDELKEALFDAQNMIDEMDVYASITGLQGTKEWDEIYERAGIFQIYDKIKLALANTAKEQS